VTRFADFVSSLRVAPDILSDRLAMLIEAGVMEKRRYQEPGRRARESYHLTKAGMDLKIVLGALQQWGDEHLPHKDGPSAKRRDRRTREPLSVGFVNGAGSKVPLGDVEFVLVSGGFAKPASDAAAGPPRRGSARKTVRHKSPTRQM
jgi:DNA-binding HxlR family transcriptional regulator